MDVAPHPRRSLRCVVLALSVGCGAAVGRQQPSDFHFAGTAAVRASPGSGSDWLLVLETLQPQLLVTSPIRKAALLDTASGATRTFDAPEGWVLVDATAHPSGDVSLLSVRADSPAPYPLRVVISRFGADGARVDHELSRIVPATGEAPPVFMTSLDRARIVATGEDLYAVVRWANNAVQAYRLASTSSGLQEQWATWVEPPASLGFLGIIGGGFDNFHQGDSAFFVYADVDARGNLVVAVASTAEVLAAHDAFFGETLTAQADPANFEFGVAIVTPIGSDGTRGPARLLGVPGRRKRLLNVRVVGEQVALLGRVKTGDQPGSWDGWILSFDPATGRVAYERDVDVQDGDVFWDAAALGDGRILAVGSTNYAQNPAGLSVSDARDALAVVLDASGALQQRISLPGGPAGRGNEAISVAIASGGEVAIAGVQNAPGTHAPVYSDAFLALRDPNSL